MIRLLFASMLLLALAAGCGTAAPDGQEFDVKVDTESELAWQQHLANIAFADDYQPRCVSPAGVPEGVDSNEPRRPRVLITGFGRFLSNRNNATGRMVSHILEELEYPETEPPASGEIDPPAQQTSVALGVVSLPQSGEVDVCAMVLPVFWDLSAVLVLKELEAFQPDFVLMNGIAGYRQPIWLELGAVNKAKALDDGSGILSPVETGAALVPSASVEDYARPQLLSWQSVREAADRAIEEHGDDTRDGTPLSDVLHGARFAGYPRRSNTYLCNNVTYTVGYVMDHPGESIRLMEASHPREEGAAFLDIRMGKEHNATPRLFVHWPSDLKDDHVASGAAVMLAMVDAQLNALSSADGEAPARGDNDMAELAPDEGGDTF
jgi:pyrrolidone-carboxylate peptidase